MASLATGSLRASFAERGHDLYETPEVAVEALLRVEPLPHNIWEPACGPGKIVNVLRRHGHRVLATDLIAYGFGQGDHDFLLKRELPYGVEAIVTNPPFKHAEKFVAKALSLAPKVVMLLRLAFLESERRRPILDNGTLARVYVFRKRLPMMHRAGWEGKKGNSAMAFAWFVWDWEHSGPAELRRLSWEEK